MPANIVTAGGVATGAGSATLPTMALVGSTANRLELIEISVINTTAVACVFGLFRISAAGTPGTSLTSASHDTNDPTTGVVKNTYTVTPTAGADFGFRFSIPATIGAGVIRPFTPVGLVIPATANAGIGLFPIGTGQICNIDMTWVEV